MLPMMGLEVGPYPCLEVPIDYDDVKKVGLEHPLVHSSVAAVGADLEIEMRFAEIDSASAVVEGCIRHWVRGVESAGSFPCSHIADV